MSELEFKGTKKEMFPIEIAGFYVIHDGQNYEDHDVLDFDFGNDVYIESEEVRKEIAFANAKLFCASYELLEALQNIMPFAKEWINENHPAMIKANLAIKKAIGNE